jgi:preprotein translocase subunit SecE
MANKKETVGFLGNMLEPALYKRNQGRLTRQLTALSFALIIFLGAWTLSGELAGKDVSLRVGIPVILAAIGGWIVYRAVNFPSFADFLISVEAEMDKVTWATKSELYRSTVVVISVMFFLGFALFVYDLFWQWFFQLIGFLQINSDGA